MTELSLHNRSQDSHNMKLKKLFIHFLFSIFELWILQLWIISVLRPVVWTQRSHMNYDCSETCCVDSAQSYELWLFWDLLCGLSAAVLRPVVWTQRSHMYYDRSETCCVDSAQSFDIMTVLQKLYSWLQQLCNTAAVNKIKRFVKRGDLWYGKK
jgi:hypothetical protein